RISISAPSSYFCTFRASILSVFHCECNVVPGIMNLGEMYDLAGLIVPRPLYCINGKEDPIFPIESTLEAFGHVTAIYEAFGYADRRGLFIGDGGHRYYKAGVWDFVRSQWQGSERIP